MRENADSDKVHRGSYRTNEINKVVYADISAVYDRFEEFLKIFIDKIDTDLMPGV